MKLRRLSVGLESNYFQLSFAPYFPCYMQWLWYPTVDPAPQLDPHHIKGTLHLQLTAMCQSAHL